MTGSRDAILLLLSRDIGSRFIFFSCFISELKEREILNIGIEYFNSWYLILELDPSHEIHQEKVGFSKV